MTQRILNASGGIEHSTSPVARSAHALDQISGKLVNYPMSGYVNSYGTVNATPTVNVLYAVPFPSSRGGFLSDLRVQVLTLGSGSSVRMGLYKATSLTNLYPNALVVDAGAVSTATTGTKVVSTGMGIKLTPATLYWTVLVSTGTSAVLRGGDVNCMWPIFGITSAMGTALGVGLSVAFTYAALPATFPTGAAALTAAPIPIISGQWAA